jgi:hypothetical protein
MKTWRVPVLLTGRPSFLEFYGPSPPPPRIVFGACERRKAWITGGMTEHDTAARIAKSSGPRYIRPEPPEPKITPAFPKPDRDKLSTNKQSRETQED